LLKTTHLRLNGDLGLKALLTDKLCGEKIFKKIMSAQEKFQSILIFGPAGSGKGTLSKTLASAGGHCHLSSGDIFRSLAPTSPMGKLFHEYGSKGKLVPDEVTIEVVTHHVEQLIASDRYAPQEQFLLLDGIPRTVKQAELLDKRFEVIHIILLQVDNIEVLMQRLTRRSKIEKRSDDEDIQAVRTRLDLYEKVTAPLLDHYPKKLIHRFNAAQHPLEVLRDVLKELAVPLSARYRLSS
jgi:adenylate kinase